MEGDVGGTGQADVGGIGLAGVGGIGQDGVEGLVRQLLDHSPVMAGLWMARSPVTYEDWDHPT